MLANLDHPNLPKVSDYFSDGGNEYIVMEYVEGEDLASVLARHGGPLPEQSVLPWADQVLDALEYLHGQRPNPILHRDIKPANIILTPQGRIKLVDFGLVKLLDPNNPHTATAMKGMGTPEYTPLEQYASGVGHTDARSDIYALGATLYHLLTGVGPGQRATTVAEPGQPRRAEAVGTVAFGEYRSGGAPERWRCILISDIQTAREMRTTLLAGNVSTATRGGDAICFAARRLALAAASAGTSDSGHIVVESTATRNGSIKRAHPNCGSGGRCTDSHTDGRAYASDCTCAD